MGARAQLIKERLKAFYDRLDTDADGQVRLRIRIRIGVRIPKQMDRHMW